MLLLFIEIGNLVDIVDASVDLDADVALLADALEHRLVLALALAHNGSDDQDARALGQRVDTVYDLIDALPLYGLTAVGAMRVPYARVKEPQIIAYLGHRADGRTRIVGGTLLVY